MNSMLMRSEQDGTWTIIGDPTVPLPARHDRPAAPEAIAAVADCKQAGIRAVMITGDHEKGCAETSKFSGRFSFTEPQRLMKVGATAG
jgi:hypothetical protein